MKNGFVGNRTKNITKWIRFKPMAEWFESNILLLKGAVRGKFRVSLAPHTQRIFEELDKDHVNTITLKVSSQTQKTTIGLGAIMKWIATDYHDMFFMINKAKDIKKFLAYKIKPMLEGTPIVKKMLTEYQQEESERKHSHFYSTSQNLFAVISIHDTKSITTKYGVFDEAAEFPKGVISEALERMKEYGDDYKALITSTQIHPNDEVNYYFNISEAKIQYMLSCPHCEEYFYPMPENLKFITLDEFKKQHNISLTEDYPFDKIMSDYKPLASSMAYLECPHCTHSISNKERVDSILGGKCEWIEVEAKQSSDGSILWEEANNIKTYYESIGCDVNTALAPRVPLKRFAQKEIECMYAEPHMQNTLYDKFYAGYWNQIYVPQSTGATEKNDILLLSNGCEIGVVPDNIYALHLGVDLQYDSLYYVLGGLEYISPTISNPSGMILHIIEYGRLFSNGEGDDLLALKDIIDTEWGDKNNNKYRIQSAGCDIRGFSLDDPNSRSNQMLDFIFDYALTLRAYGVEDWQSFIYPMWGVGKLNNPSHEAQGYRVHENFTREIEVEGVDEKIKIQAISFSNMRIKTMFHNMMSRSIEKAKSKDGDEAHKYNQKLLYITQEAVTLAEDRESLPYHERGDKHSLEAHLTAEHLTHKIYKNGKVSDTKTYEKKRSGIRNDYGDCVDMIISQSLKHDTYRTPIPTPEQEVNYSDVLDGIQGVFG